MISARGEFEAKLMVHQALRRKFVPMLQLVIDYPLAMADTAPDAADEFGDIPEDRTGWHPLARQLYDYWRLIAPPGRLPGRQHLVPEDIAPLWSRAAMLEVFRNPLRFRYRLCGTEMVRLLGREVTGEWLDEVHPALISQSREQLQFVVETGCPTWRRGPPLWTPDPKPRMVETCIVPLAGDGRSVDRMLGVSVLFDGAGRPL
jgi:hypothetical protein